MYHNRVCTESFWFAGWRAEKYNDDLWKPCSQWACQLSVERCRLRHKKMPWSVKPCWSSHCPTDQLVRMHRPLHVLWLPHVLLNYPHVLLWLCHLSGSSAQWCLYCLMRGTMQEGGPASFKNGCPRSSWAVALWEGSLTSIRSRNPRSTEETCENSDTILRADTESPPPSPEMLSQRIPRKIILPSSNSRKSAWGERCCGSKSRYYHY